MEGWAGSGYGGREITDCCSLVQAFSKSIAVLYPRRMNEQLFWLGELVPSGLHWVLSWRTMKRC
jgi:hypothetical protein